jgi:HSP20 family protein
MANMSRWDPFSEAMSLREAMQNLFEDSYVNSPSSRGTSLSMPLDVAETEDGFVVEAALPGVKSEDLDITLQNNILTISGEVRQSHTEGAKPNYHRVERRYGRFSRAISLPTQVDSTKVEAQLNNGILRLHLPKAEAVKPRKISISTNGNGSTRPLEVATDQPKAREVSAN